MLRILALFFLINKKNRFENYFFYSVDIAKNDLSRSSKYQYLMTWFQNSFQKLFPTSYDFFSQVLRSNKFGLSKSLLALKIVSYIVNLA
jgi:hypothetical protein